MRRENLYITIIALLAMFSFWGVAGWLVPAVTGSSRYSMALCCLWAILLGVLLHWAHAHGKKHRSADGGVKFLFVLLLLLVLYVVVRLQLVYLGAATGGFVADWAAAMPDLLHYPVLWVNQGVDWVVVLLAGTGGGGLLGRFNGYQWLYLPIIVACLFSYLLGHLFTVCFCRRR